jgi:voltage-gated potassium channel Kch
MKQKTLQRESKPLRAFLSQYHWTIVGVLILVAFVFGFYGLKAYFLNEGEARTNSDLIYLTLRLFILEYEGFVGPIPWQLEVGRFFAPLILAYSAVIALLGVMQDQLQLFRARISRNHVVICGLGDKGLAIAKALQNADKRVIAIEKEKNNSHISICRDLGVIVLIGDATEPDYLCRASIRKANHLFAVCGDDGANAQIAGAARTLVGNRRKGILTCLIHIVDRNLAKLLAEKEITSKGADAFRLEFFSIYTEGARVLLDKYPAFPKNADQPPPATHILVIGLNELSESLILKAARLWHERCKESGQILRVTVIDPLASRDTEILKIQTPQLESACSIESLDISIDSPEFYSGQYLRNDRKSCDFSQIYICLQNETVALQTALTVRHQLKRQQIPTVVCMNHQSGLALHLAEENGSGQGFGLDSFGLLDATCTADLLENSTNEVLARAIHENYVANQKAEGATPNSNSSIRPWNELPKTLQESNRRQADHFGEKLKSAGCEIRRSYVWDIQLFKFNQSTIEILAEAEHDRWVTERKADGWKYRPGKKDIDSKKSPYLVPWNKLSDEIKEYDRHTVVNLARYLAMEGFEIVQVSPDAPA